MSDNKLRRLGKTIAVLLLFFFSPVPWSQAASSQNPAAPDSQPDIPQDTLGRDTAKGTVFVALHRGSRAAKVTYQGRPAAVLNVGTLIHSVLGWLRISSPQTFAKIAA
jgi:hypothetical protein